MNFEIKRSFTTLRFELFLLYQGFSFAHTSPNRCRLKNPIQSTLNMVIHSDEMQVLNVIISNEQGNTIAQQKIFANKGSNAINISASNWSNNKIYIVHITGKAGDELSLRILNDFINNELQKPANLVAGFFVSGKKELLFKFLYSTKSNPYNFLENSYTCCDY